MRNTIPRLLSLTVTVALCALITPIAHAGSGTSCTGDNSRGAVCTVTASDGGSTGAASEAAGAPAGTASEMVCTYGGAQIPCTSEWGTWSQSRSCYIRSVTEAEIGADKWALAMAGHTDGVVLACTLTSGSVDAIVITQQFFWAESSPQAGPDPATVAATAIESMSLHMGTLASNPPQSPDPTIMGLVGYPVWLWISDPSESTTGPITRTATAGSVTVTATATLSSIRWSMGDGTTVTCLGAGTPWHISAGNAASPTCGHTYTQTSADQPGMTYTVTATATWSITWSGGGQSGSQTLTFTDTTRLRIGEAQVLLTGAGS